MVIVFLFNQNCHRESNMPIGADVFVIRIVNSRLFIPGISIDITNVLESHYVLSME